jgi:hypothetical protein
MSYGVDILSGETPKSYEEALVVRDRMTDARDSRLDTGSDGEFEQPSADMRALHDRLTARYPCITVDPDNGPWSDGPLINNFGRRSATLGLSFSRVSEVLPFLITTATEMGFWVLDAQEELVHLPGGVTIAPGSPPERPPSVKSWWQFWK